MATRNWKINLDGKDHLVEFNHNYWSSLRQLTVDNAPVKIPESVRKPLIDYGGTIPFQIDRHQCAVIIKNKYWRYGFDLTVDRMSTSTGKEVTDFFPKTTTPEELKRNIFWRFYALFGQIKSPDQAKYYFDLLSMYLYILLAVEMIGSLEAGLYPLAVLELFGIFCVWFSHRKRNAKLIIVILIVAIIDFALETIGWIMFPREFGSEFIYWLISVIMILAAVRYRKSLRIITTRQNII